ncbi:hypothetical protein TWF751_009433 [Orbilia oligospora]|nr:hypothetical protein TWF751_009433 [Orbilia oligospora]
MYGAVAAAPWKNPSTESSINRVYLSRANEPRTPSYNPKIRACIHRKEPSQAQTSSSFRAELEKTDRATGKPANDNYFPNELELRIPAPESAGFFKSP